MPGGFNDDFNDDYDIGYDGPVPAAPVLTGWTLSATSNYLEVNFVPSATGYDFYSCDSDGSNPVLLSTANTTNWTVESLTAATLYYYVAKARNGTGPSDTYSNILTLTTKALKPKLSLIKDAIEQLVLSMTIAGGYNYTWLSAGQSDLAKVVGFPAVVYEFDPLENNERAENAADTNSYANKVTIRIDSWNEISAAEIASDLGLPDPSPLNIGGLPDDPQCAFKLVMDKMLDDLKRLFGRNWWLTADTGVERIDYIKSERIWSKSGDILKPGKLATWWDVTYSQSRIEPTVTAP